MGFLVLESRRYPCKKRESFLITLVRHLNFVKTEATHRALVVFDVPDDVVVNRAVGLRYDPVTNRTYHVKFDPPPKNSQIEARLIRKASDTEPNMRARLSIYRKNLKGVTTAFANNLNVLSFSEGIIGNEETVYKDVFNILGRKPSTKAPRAFKIVVAGLPGSGKTKVAEALQQKFGFVHGKPFLTLPK